MKHYEAPEINVVLFQVEDVIATSSLAIKSGDNEYAPPAGWWD